MKAKLLNILWRLRIMDGDGTLSLTSIALLVVLWKLTTASELNLADASVFLAACTAHQAKKLIGQRSGKSADTEVVASLGMAVKNLTDKVQVLDNRTRPENRR